ncbi:MAG: cyclohexanecarboxylate-CoA ligase [Burkholderiaceae bacterium]|nr:MAG: cyclohexanecarboxylate-CoA ligase [Burkholderiaceae bacterium]TBR76478.1 MAG: cyclohexanecarboxylate-CoA ligase [Burkholderiaceae bacterium]
MKFDAILIPARRAQMIAAGLWHDRTINDELDACLAQCPDKLALTATHAGDGAVRRFTYREMAGMADRIAIGLHRLGVGKDDVVACQLPNGWQFTLMYLACSRIGAVMNPLMTIFRARELGFMLAHGEAKIFVCPKLFRGFDYEQMGLELQAQLPRLERVVTIGGTAGNSFEKLLSGPAWEKDPDARTILCSHRPGPDDVTQLIYTSGTTGEPKGAMHTANTLFANILPYAERLGLGRDDVILMASPMAHQTGFMYGLMMPIILRASAVLQDIWDPKKAIDLIRAEKATFTMASTPFLTDLARNVADGGLAVPTLKTFLCAGAPIPGPLVEQARAALGADIVSAWGMTENGAVTTTLPSDPPDRSVNTDGVPLPGVEVKVAAVDGTALPTGESGRLLLRACSNFGGYLKRPQLNNTDAQGWFDTGDLARLDDKGYIRITGRSKDVIIRGGENIPVMEIEALLYKHPAVQQVAIVAYPDDRLGERACAVVVAKPGQHFDLAMLVEHLKALKVAAPYMPERVLLQDAMPTTPSGKIQKFKLREMVLGSPS